MLAFGLTGCGQQVGSAAVVGSVAINADSVNSQAQTLSSVQSPTTISNLVNAKVLIDTGRRVLSDEIRHQVLAQNGLTLALTDDQIAQIIAAYQGADSLAGELMATPEQLNQRIADAATLRVLVTQALQGGTAINGPRVTVDVVATADVAAAEALRTRYLADPAAMTADVEAGRATQTGGRTTLSILDATPLVGTGLFSALPGQLVVVNAGTQALIARIVDRSITPLAVDSATFNTLTPSQIEVLGGLLLAEQLPAAAVQVQVNPRFGVWDASVMQVVAAAGRS